MGKFLLGALVAVALALVIAGVLAAVTRPRPEPARLTSMAETGRAMLRAGEAMQAHGQAMLEEGRRSNDQDLVGHGEHWLRDGQTIAQGGRWMAGDPLAPGSLVTAPAELSQQGSWGALLETTRAMLHDPSQARSAVDVQAVRWNGQAMQAEGQNMAEHGRVMAEEIGAMVAGGQLADESAGALRQAAATLVDTGAALQSNGQAMVEYADRLQRAIGIVR